MNRRIRKKKHLGEFDYKGFEVTCNYDTILDLAGVNAFMDSVTLLGDSNGLHINGSFGPGGADFIVTRLRQRPPGDKRRWGYTHCTEADRELIGDHLKSFPHMGDIHISELKGMWR